MPQNSDQALYPRPLHWRPSYPSRFSPLLPNFFARLGRSAFFQAVIILRLQLLAARVDRLLRHDSKSLPQIRYDLRYHLPPDPRFSLPASHRIPRADDLWLPATTPALSYLSLWHRRLPWYLAVFPSHPPRGVTIADVLGQLSAALALPVYVPEYWTTALPEDDRSKILESCRVRQTILAPGIHTGSSICRVDYLRQDVIFAGLAPSADGSFEIRTIPFI